MYTIDFMRAHANWRELLAAPPYCLRIVENDDLVLFKYTMGCSDYNEPLVLECRGLIVDKATLQPVCYPFNKFFNSVEPHAAAIDWPTARVQQKVDGTLLCAWFWRDEWHFSTTGTIDCGILFPSIRADMAATHFTTTNLNPLYTYMFEWTSPRNQIVVPWAQPSFFLLGRRNNTTLKEEQLQGNEGFKVPAAYPLQSLRDVREAAAQLDWHNEDGEGFVVVDDNWNRVKVKNPEYVKAHYMRNNGNVGFATLWQVILDREEEEFIAYVPYLKDELRAIRKRVEEFEASVDFARHELQNISERKEYAAKAQLFGKEIAACLLSKGTTDEFLRTMRRSKAKELFGFSEN